MTSSIKDRLALIHDKIAHAAEISGRKPRDITLVGVTKTLPSEMVIDGYNAGLRNFGENRLQGAPEKIIESRLSIGDKFDDSVWHFIGTLQKNKVRKVVDHFDYIQSLDSHSLIQRVDRIAGETGRKLHGLIQINVSSAESQQGVMFEKIEEFVENIPEIENLTIDGIMTIGPNTNDNDEIRRSFSLIRKLSEKLSENRIKNINFNTISMGMSGDYEIAIEEGATLVRIGTAIFGPRKV
jgi:PLP dependent protein